MEVTTLIALIIFVATYAAVLSGKVHKTVAVLIGGCAMILLHVVSEEEAFASIDLSVIFLLIGMMIIVHFLAESGFFGFVAIRLAQLAKGKPVPLMLLLCSLTAALSAFVDNVTTVLLMAPVTFLLAERLEVSPIPYVLLEALASNVGGTATLIGDPPNILIGSAAGLSFNDFLINLAPIAIVCLGALLGMAVLVISKESYVSSDIRARVMEMDAAGAIRDRNLLKMSGSVLMIVLALFLVHGVLHIKPATIALAGGAALLLLTKTDPDEVYKTIEWSTLFFFIGLFLVVSGLAATGLLDHLARAILSLTNHQLFPTCMVVMWFAAATSAVLGCVPVVTALIPVMNSIIPSMIEHTGNSASTIESALWWSLALGACFGGNGTMFGTAANVVVVGIARHNRHDISFMQFLRYGVPVAVITLLMSSVYIAIRYIP